MNDGQLSDIWAILIECQVAVIWYELDRSLSL